jgi:hypothetical protein
MEDDRDNKIAPIGFFMPQIFKSQKHTMFKKFLYDKNELHFLESDEFF